MCGAGSGAGRREFYRGCPPGGWYTNPDGNVDGELDFLKRSFDHTPEVRVIHDSDGTALLNDGLDSTSFCSSRLFTTFRTTLARFQACATKCFDLGGPS